MDLQGGGCHENDCHSNIVSDPVGVVLTTGWSGNPSTNRIYSKQEEADHLIGKICNFPPEKQLGIELKYL